MQKLIKKFFSYFRKKEKLLKCPACKGSDWIKGSGGGSYGNIQCVKCKNKYNNLGPFGLEKIN